MDELPSTADYHAITYKGWIVYLGWGRDPEGIRPAWQVVGRATREGYATATEACEAIG